MQPKTVLGRNSTPIPFNPAVTVFICANAAREGQSPTCSRRRRPSVPRFNWPFAVKEVLVPCTGRIQPEHLLKAFETGADAVCVIACDEGNCHHLEGSRRAKRRVDYVAGLLEDIGLGAQRLMMFHLPGSAREDMALGAEDAAPAAAGPSPERAAQVQAIVDEAVARIGRLPPNLMPVPGEAPPPPEATYEIEQPEEESDE
jgi:coenzyme F420-reducing hydrogenase delta subunit